MSTALVIDEKKYGRLLTRALPVVIETEEEYERLLAQAGHLMERDEENLSVEEEKLLALLVHLLNQYEDKRYPVTPANAHASLQHLMASRALTHKDVWSLFGSKGVASEVLNGKRAISKTQAKKLAEFFHVSPELFLSEPVRLGKPA